MWKINSVEDNTEIIYKFAWIPTLMSNNDTIIWLSFYTITKKFINNQWIITDKSYQSQVGEY